MVYLHKNYKELIEYDFEKNTYKIVNYDEKLDEKNLGKVDILNSNFIGMFFYKHQLYLVTGKVQIPFEQVSMDFISKDINEDIIERKLIIKEDGVPVDEIIYQINKTEIIQQITYTEMAEVEDWDFGLFLANLLDDKERQKRFLEGYLNK